MHFELHHRHVPLVCSHFTMGGCVFFVSVPINRARSTYRIGCGERCTQCLSPCRLFYSAGSAEAVEPTAMMAQNSAITPAYAFAGLGASPLVKLNYVQQSQDNRHGVPTRPGRSSQASTNHATGRATPLSLTRATLPQHG